MSEAGPEASSDGGSGSWLQRLRRRVVLVATDPGYRRLRWILVIGLLVRLAFAPLSSWAVDTNGFVLSGESALYYGNPYAATTWFNPPLAPFLAAPFLAIPTLLYGPQSLIISVSAITPVVVKTGVDAAYFPIPAALLAWKLPLIVSDLGVGLGLRWLAAEYRLAVAPDTLLAAWFLNPLVIWASSVHGEVDTLAALFVLLFLGATLKGRWAPAGLFLGLAFLSKGYPLVLVPMAITAVAVWPVPEVHRWGPRLRALGWWTVGLGAALLPFVGFLPRTYAILNTKAGNPAYGGISILGIFNAASPKGSAGWYFEFTTHFVYAASILTLFRVLAIVGVLAGLALFAYRLRKHPSDPTTRLRWLAVTALGAVAGIILADPVPEPENIVALLPLALLALATHRAKWEWWAFALLSGAGLALYWAFLTPMVMFYPLWNLLGIRTILWVNGVAIAYSQVPILRGAIWLATGLVGGTVVILLWASSLARLMPAETVARIRGVLRRRETASVRPPV